ncbi:MAG: acetolactate synthase [Dysgonamonadaceae bacterium]|jgi:hypothetical protein|nr:acetolactate synthase [Dysgonamonadaceae bacterium]
MTIQQISIFLENKFGKLNEILSLISKEQIRIIAATVADTSEFGILRILTSDPQKAFKVLKNNNISANISEVFAIVTESVPGQFARTIEYFTRAGISIEYMYCFSTKVTGILVIRVNDTETAREVIRRKNLQTIDQIGLKEI